MSMETRLIFILPFSLLLLVCTANGIDFNRALQNENRQCFVPKYTANVNATWYITPRRWFYPVMSVLNLYIHGLETSKRTDAAALPEDELYYDACMTYDLSAGPNNRSWETVVTGFGGLQTTLTGESNDGFRSINWIYPPQTFPVATSYVTLTDNKTFIFIVTCREYGMTWAVLTTYQPISEETNRVVEEHALSLGFKMEYFTGLRYDTCPAYSRVTQLSNSDNVSLRKFRRSNILRQQPYPQRQQWGRLGVGQGWK